MAPAVCKPAFPLYENGVLTGNAHVLHFVPRTNDHSIGIVKVGPWHAAEGQPFLLDQIETARDLAASVLVKARTDDVVTR